MKNAIVWAVVVFLLVTIVFTWGFIHLFSYGATIGMATLRNIVVDRALLMSIPIALAYFSIHMVVIKIENRWLWALAIPLILVALYVVLAYFYFFNIIITSLLESPFVD